VQIGLILHLVCGFALLFTKTLVFAYVLIFFLGLSTPMRAYIGYVYAMEFMQQKHTGMATSILFFNDGLTIAVASLWFKYVGKTWQPLFIIYWLIVLFAFICVTCYLGFSPKQLHSMGRYDETR